MLITDTYILININQINAFKSIEHFKLDLGMSLTNESKQFIPNDVNVQKHYMFFDNIMSKCGSIGKLQIYSSFKIPTGTIELYNERNKLTYELNSSKNLYDEVNNALDAFFTKFDLNTDIKPETENKAPDEAPIYEKPDKPMSEMTMPERIAYLRSLE